MKSQKLIDYSLRAIQQLVSLGFLKGDCLDNTKEYHLEEYKDLLNNSMQNQNGKQERQLVEVIIDDVIQCINDKDENLMNCVISILVKLSTSYLSEIHGGELPKIVKVLINIYSSHKSIQIQKMAKQALFQVSNYIFKRLEEPKEENLLQQAREITQNQIRLQKQQGQQLRGLDEISSPRKDQETEKNLGNSEREIIQKKTSNVDLNQKQILNQNQNQDDFCIDVAGNFYNLVEQRRQQNNNSVETICFDTVKNLVDNVELYYEKIKIVESEISEEQNEEVKNLELQNIPLNPVPKQLDSDDLQYRRIIKTELKNEIGQVAGDFGWCINCRKGASYYCKDFRIPICGNECQKEYVEDMNQISQEFNQQKNIINTYEYDAKQVFITFCSLIEQQQIENQGGLSKTQVFALQEQLQKQKLLILEIINEILFKYQFFFQKDINQKQLIRKYLMNGIYKCCLNSEQDIFIYAVNIFWSVVDKFKECVKNEIYIFIKEIFLKLLNSNNSSHPHREISLKVLRKIFQNNNNLLEFFMNYDCSFDHSPLIENTVDILSKIANGYYNDKQFQVVVDPQQSVNLQQLAILTLYSAINSLYNFYEDYQRERQVHEKEEQKHVGQLDETVVDNSVINNDNNIHVVDQKDSAKEIANFLINNNIDTVQLGEYIGGYDPLNIQVLEQFTFSQDFKGLNVEQGLRQFLQTFQLPKEAQQVDRIVQKFGEKYYQDNPEDFNSSDGVYTFSYLLIMLQTDQHNPQVQEKMSFEAFSKLANGIEGENLDQDKLMVIYKAIQKTPLAIPEESKKQNDLQNTIELSLRKKKDMFVEETKEMLKRGSELIGQIKASQYYTVNQNSVYYIKPLMENVTKKLLISFKQGLQQNDSRTVDKSIEAMGNCIKLTAMFGLNEEKDALMSELYKSAQINLAQNLVVGQNFKRKNFKIIKNILEIANSFSYTNLNQAWIYPLQCISWIAAKNLMGKRDEYKELKDQDKIQVSFNQENIERIFYRSQYLDGSSILDFIQALCNISKEELNFVVNPQIYSLQKNLEVAILNMGRINIQWNNIWKIIREHFNDVGVHNNLEVAKTGIKFLTELSIKFLQSERFKEDTFRAQLQKEFLKPFEIIFQKCPPQNFELKGYILGCIKIISQNYNSKLKSGWRIVFNVINLALNEDKENISQRAYLILKDIMELQLQNIDDVFLDLVSSLKKLSKKRYDNLAFNSIAHVKRCLIYLSDKKNIKPFERKQSQELKQEEDSSSNNNNQNNNINNINEEENNKIQEDQQQVDLKNQLQDQYKNLQEIDKVEFTKYLGVYWMPLLDVLSNLCGDTRPAIQEKAMETLFEILIKYGYCFSVEFWKMIFQGVLRPLFDEIMFTVQNQNKNSTNWLRKQCQTAFTYITDLMDLYFENLQNLVKELIKTYEGCIQSANEGVVKLSINSLKNTLMRIGNRFGKQEWDIVIDFFERIFKLTTPVKLISKNNGLLIEEVQVNEQNEEVFIFKKQQQDFKYNCEECVTQCIAQLLLISVVKEVTESFIDQLDRSHLNIFDSLLQKSYEFAKTFNQQLERRFFLWKNGFTDDKQPQLPGLLKQEREAQGCKIILEFHIYRQYELQDPEKNLLTNLLKNLKKYLQLFMQCHDELAQIQSMKQSQQYMQQDMYLAQIIQLNLDQIDTQLYKNIFSRLDEIEQERETQNLRTLVCQTILPILDQLESDEVQSEAYEIFEILTDITKYSSSKCISCMMCKGCKYCENCVERSDELDQQVRDLLKKFFKFSLQNFKNSREQSFEETQSQLQQQQNQQINSSSIIQQGELRQTSHIFLNNEEPGQDLHVNLENNQEQEQQEQENKKQEKQENENSEHQQEEKDDDNEQKVNQQKQEQEQEQEQFDNQQQDQQQEEQQEEEQNEQEKQLQQDE
ncbi:Sec7 domain [Pseudocohnilembus persalinus]|uniref:Sec7 domain n=1 Tax=Pseudocohnilembus persalinus TaxID=266149 RepID=A0A0V0QXJ9_PSEPJ|nr:Sec7 domain [Pseudocohnilembus persalinus]|eukprot:KRX07107.1 Sec7 domain [Pseudocohnilembus persalinus]